MTRIPRRSRRIQEAVERESKVSMPLRCDLSYVKVLPLVRSRVLVIVVVGGGMMRNTIAGDWWDSRYGERTTAPSKQTVDSSPTMCPLRSFLRYTFASHSVEFNWLSKREYQCETTFGLYFCFYYRVLVFPPVNNYRRYLIHQLVQDRFGELLKTFSIGQGLARRTVVCYQSDVIRYSNTFLFLPVDYKILFMNFT